ncbi:MAG: ribosome biogenesis GTPase Der [Candidatus Omnitrophica bacterium]|nr:ribosome biogenesis GTPase Der [Candidatus Omnitrophota bacterium]
MDKEYPSVCIVGRPNVGKSSLFNWFAGERKAVVLEESGTTRDRVEAVIELFRRKVTVSDTGGYLQEDTDKMSVMVKQQIRNAIKEADVLIMVTDAQAGVVPADIEIAAIIRKADKPVILAVNKADNRALDADSVDFFQLGLGDPLPVSCLHRRGMETLKEAVRKVMPDEFVRSDNNDKSSIKIAVVGRPNVGKSSYINYILKRDRVIVSDMPGTTRDSVDIFFNDGKNDYTLIDTAGIRHSRKIFRAVDVFSIMRSKGSIKRADVVIFLLDSVDGATHDDLAILRYIMENGKACIVIINKWDLARGVEDVDQEGYHESLIAASPVFRVFPVFFVSSVSGRNVMKSFASVKQLNDALDREFQTSSLNKIFEKNDPSKVPVPRSDKRPNFMYITQTGKRPVEFTFFVNSAGAVTPGHLSYIENVLRKNVELEGIPISIKIRAAKEKKERK